VLQCNVRSSVSYVTERVLNATARVVCDTKKFDHGLSTRHSCTTNCTDWMCLRGSPSSSASWRTVICTDKHLSTSLSTLPQSLKLHLDIDYVLHTDTGSLYHTVDSTRTAVGLFRSLVQRSGTHCQMNSRDPAFDIDSFK